MFPQPPVIQPGVSDAIKNSALTAVVGWVTRTIAATPLRVFDGTQFVDDHPAGDLLRAPNPYYGERLLRSAVVGEMLLYGEAFLLKERSQSGRVLRVWFLSHGTVRVETRQQVSYIYGPTGKVLDPEDIIHLRYRLAPDGVRGVSPITSVLNEVLTDNEAALFTAAILRNSGVPGVVISPASADTIIDKETAEAVRVLWQQRVTGELRGQPIVFTDRVDVETFGFSPNDVLLDKIRRIPEERICAVFGVPAIVAGLGAGLERSTFANYSEAREAAFEECIFPIQQLLAEEMTRQLLAEYGDSPPNRFEFDNSGIGALGRGRREEMAAIASLVQAGIISTEEARGILRIGGSR